MSGYFSGSLLFFDSPRDKKIRGLLDLSFTLSRVFEALSDHVYVFFIVFLSREHLRLPNFVVSTFTSSKSLGF